MAIYEDDEANKGSVNESPEVLTITADGWASTGRVEYFASTAMENIVLRSNGHAERARPIETEIKTNIKSWWKCGPRYHLSKYGPGRRSAVLGSSDLCCTSWRRSSCKGGWTTPLPSSHHWNGGRFLLTILDPFSYFQ